MCTYIYIYISLYFAQSMFDTTRPAGLISLQFMSHTIQLKEMVAADSVRPVVSCLNVDPVVIASGSQLGQLRSNKVQQIVDVFQHVPPKFYWGKCCKVGPHWFDVGLLVKFGDQISPKDLTPSSRIPGLPATCFVKAGNGRICCKSASSPDKRW